MEISNSVKEFGLPKIGNFQFYMLVLLDRFAGSFKLYISLNRLVDKSINSELIDRY